MADRYQDKSFTADDDYDRGSQHAPAKGESDPLAELARLIGQTDPFSSFGRANQPMPPRETDPYHRPEPEPEPDRIGKLEKEVEDLKKQFEEFRKQFE